MFISWVSASTSAASARGPRARRSFSGTLACHHAQLEAAYWARSNADAQIGLPMWTRKIDKIVRKAGPAMRDEYLSKGLINQSS